MKEKREKRAGRLQLVVRPRPRAVRHSTDRRHLPLSVLTRPPSRFAACLVRTLLLLPCGPRWSAGLQYSAYRGTVSATLQVCLSYGRFRALQDRTSRLAQRAPPLNEGFQLRQHGGGMGHPTRSPQIHIYSPAVVYLTAFRRDRCELHNPESISCQTERRRRRPTPKDCYWTLRPTYTYSREADASLLPIDCHGIPRPTYSGAQEPCAVEHTLAMPYTVTLQY